MRNRNCLLYRKSIKTCISLPTKNINKIKSTRSNPEELNNMKNFNYIDSLTHFHIFTLGFESKIPQLSLSHHSLTNHTNALKFIKHSFGNSKQNLNIKKIKSTRSNREELNNMKNFNHIDSLTHFHAIHTKI